jgi:CAAX prenyl protease-like protein
MHPQTEHSPLPFILPLLAFMLIGMLEPGFALPSAEQPVSAQAASPPKPDSVSEANEAYVRDRQFRTAVNYCLVYAIKTLVTCSILFWFWRVYHRSFPVSATFWSVVVGGIGVVVWIALCQMQLEQKLFDWFRAEAEGTRSQFNPFAELPGAALLLSFLTLRFFGLVVMVPVCEELFLRGFLMRYIQSPEWWTVSLGRLSTRALLVAPLYGALTHPGEFIAAIVWFSLVTWLVYRTGKFWDAVIAHAVTNLLLGIYVCLYGQWQLW